MRHLEPKQLGQQEQAAKRRPTPRLWSLAATVLALAIAGGFFATRLAPPALPDAVSAVEVQERADAYAKAKPLAVSEVTPARVAQVIDGMGLPMQDRQALVRLVNAPIPTAVQQPQRSQQPVRLVELVLWDTHAPDGDVVRITSAGYTRDVLLNKSPTVVHIPGTVSTTVQVIGITDGGGGITLGIKGSSQALLMPVISVGQTLTLPVQFP